MSFDAWERKEIYSEQIQAIIICTNLKESYMVLQYLSYKTGIEKCK